MNFKDSLEAFEKEMDNCLLRNAQSKGYGDKENGGRAFFDSVDSECPGHAAGEIRYKIKRWQAKKNPEDLIKIAAWAFLIWDQSKRNINITSRTLNQAEGELILKDILNRDNQCFPGKSATWGCAHDSKIITITECKCTCKSCRDRKLPTICTHLVTGGIIKCQIAECRCPCYTCRS